MKARIRKTGEIVDIISYNSNSFRCKTLDWVSYIDSEGEEHPNEEGLNLCWDFEVINESQETAINAMKQLEQSPNNNPLFNCIMNAFNGIMANTSVSSDSYSEGYWLSDIAIIQGTNLYNKLKEKQVI